MIVWWSVLFKDTLRLYGGWCYLRTYCDCMAVCFILGYAVIVLWYMLFKDVL